jgi:hypothetical protein
MANVKKCHICDGRDEMRHKVTTSMQSKNVLYFATDERGDVKMWRSLSLLHLRGTSTALHLERTRSGKKESTIIQLSMQRTYAMAIGDHGFLLQVAIIVHVMHLSFCIAILQ